MARSSSGNVHSRRSEPNHSDVTTAPTVPAAVIAAMVCWCALKNSSIISAPHGQSYVRLQAADLQDLLRQLQDCRIRLIN
jgi:hypothetical protein